MRIGSPLVDVMMTQGQVVYRVQVMGGVMVKGLRAVRPRKMTKCGRVLRCNTIVSGCSKYSHMQPIASKQWVCALEKTNFLLFFLENTKTALL